MRDIIDVFNESRSKIVTGVYNISDESMSAIHFWTTFLGGILHYLFIFRNPDPLGTELNNSVCNRLGSMLYLDITILNEAMKSFYFQQKIGVTDGFMKRIMKDTKGCGRMSSNDTFFYDSWFILLKT